MMILGLESEVIQVSLIPIKGLLGYRKQMILLLAYLVLGNHQLDPFVTPNSFPYCQPSHIQFVSVMT